MIIEILAAAVLIAFVLLVSYAIGDLLDDVLGDEDDY